MDDNTPKPKMIHQLTTEEKAFVLDRICAQIYIARNISLDQATIIKSLEQIDTLYRTPSEGEEFV